MHEVRGRRRGARAAPAEEWREAARVAGGSGGRRGARHDGVRGRQARAGAAQTFCQPDLGISMCRLVTGITIIVVSNIITIYHHVHEYLVSCRYHYVIIAGRP